MKFLSLSKHRLILFLTSALLVSSFLISIITAIWDSNFLMIVQALSFSILLSVFITLAYAIKRWETFPEYYNENGIGRIASIIDVLIGSALLMFLSAFIYSLFFKLPESFKIDLLPVTITAFLLSGISLYSSNFVFSAANKSVYAPLLDLILKWYHKLFNVSFLFVVFHALLAFLDFYGYNYYQFVVNIMVVVVSFTIICYDSIENLKKSAKYLLNDDVTEEIRFQILSFLAEHIERFCEFKKFRVRRINDFFLIELYVVMPKDYTVDQINQLEMILNNKSNLKNLTYKIKLRTIPCNLDCYQNGVMNCPLKNISKDELL